MNFKAALTTKIKPGINHKCSLFVRVQARIGYKGGMNEILFMIGDCRFVPARR